MNSKRICIILHWEIQWNWLYQQKTKIKIFFHQFLTLSLTCTVSKYPYLWILWSGVPSVRRWTLTSNYLIEMPVTFFTNNKLFLKCHFLINSKNQENLLIIHWVWWFLRTSKTGPIFLEHIEIAMHSISGYDLIKKIKRSLI